MEFEGRSDELESGGGSHPRQSLGRFKLRSSVRESGVLSMHLVLNTIVYENGNEGGLREYVRIDLRVALATLQPPAPIGMCRLGNVDLLRLKDESIANEHLT